MKKYQSFLSGILSSIMVLAALIIPSPLPVAALDPGACAALSNSGLVGYWKLDETVARSAGDSSPSGATGTFIENSGDTPAPVLFPNPRSFLFDGIDDYVNVGQENTYEGMSALTIAFWVKKTASPTHPVLITKTNYNTQGSFRITDGHMGLNTTGGGWFTPGSSVSLTTPVALNQWTHVAYTYDGSRLRAYKNGVLDATSNPPISGTVTTNSSNVRFGFKDAYNTNYFKGYLDDVRFYNRTLTAADIELLAGGCQ